jgi:hypothetical protein
MSGYYPGYSRDEYVSEIVAILEEDYGLDSEQARRHAYEMFDVKYYGRGSGLGRAGAARSPSSAVRAYAKEHHLKKKPIHGPPMESGYAEKYIGRGEWETVVVGEDVISRAVFQGFSQPSGLQSGLSIGRSTFAIWRSGRHVYAQTAVGPRHPSHWEPKEAS